MNNTTATNHKSDSIDDYAIYKYINSITDYDRTKYINSIQRITFYEKKKKRKINSLKSLFRLQQCCCTATQPVAYIFINFALFSSFILLVISRSFDE